MKSAVQNTVIVLVSCLICIVGIEMALRVWGPDVLTIGNQRVFHQFDPTLGWVLKPHAEGRFSRLEYSYPVKINALGMWDAEIESKRSNEFRVAVLGDSFTWGIGVGYGERFTEVVEAINPKINVINFGVPGYSPIQYLLQIDSALALKSDFVIAALCLGNDLADNVAYRPYRRPKPYAALSADGQRLEIKGYPLPDTSGERGNLTDRVAFSQIAGLIDYAIDRLSEPRDEADLQRYDDGRLYAPPDKLSPDEQATVRDIFKLNELILDAINQRVTAALGPGRFAVLLVPTRYEIGQRLERWPGADPGAVAKGVLASLSRLGIPSIDGRAVIVELDFWRRDGHWRPTGHEKIGELLASFLAKNKNMPRPAPPPN